MESKPEVIDQMGDLAARIEAIEAEIREVTAAPRARLKPLKDQYAKLEELAEPWFEALPGDESAVEEGTRYLLEAGKKERKHEITDVAKLFRLARLKTVEFVAKYCKIQWGVVEKAIPEEKHPLFSTFDPTGSRTLKVVSKQATADTSGSA